MSNLFKLVMEAEGDLLEPFTPENEPDPPMPEEQQAPAGEQPPADVEGQPDTPPSAEEELNDLAFDDTGGGNEDEANPDDPQNGEQQGESQENNQSLSKMANDVLNQQLYQHMLDQNEEIEETLESLQNLIPALPYDVVVQIDSNMQRLRRALESGQDYVLHKFVGSSYGENKLQSDQLDMLYTALQNEIDSELKKFYKKSE